MSYSHETLSAFSRALAVLHAGACHETALDEARAILARELHINPPIAVDQGECTCGVQTLDDTDIIYLFQLLQEHTGVLAAHGQEKHSAPAFGRLRSRGLTARECEVLFWICEGKRDAEIAVILGCAARTVGKHVEHVLAKLGAETRQGAANSAHECLNTLRA